MLRTGRSIALTLGATILLLLGSERAEAQYAVEPDDCPPAVTYTVPPRASYYPAAEVRYYAAPSVSYYAAPAVSYYSAPSVSYFAAPSMAYNAVPPASYSVAPVATTTRYGLFGRRQVTSYYYAPVAVYP